jgi:hypothetical protein
MHKKRRKFFQKNTISGLCIIEEGPIWESLRKEFAFLPGNYESDRDPGISPRQHISNTMSGEIKQQACPRNLYECYIITSTSIAERMSLGEKIKQILYSVIEELGRENIQLKISSNIKLSQEYIEIIMNRCMSKIAYLSGIYDRDFDIAVLGEALLHYMLTTSTLPSERKVEINDSQVLDVVIPSLPRLKKDPNKSLVIHVIKDKKTDLTKIEKLESLQPNPRNIWCMSTRPLSIAKYTQYCIIPDYSSRRYSYIITDIDKFLKSTNDKSFRFIPS